MTDIQQLRTDRVAVDEARPDLAPVTAPAASTTTMNGAAKPADAPRPPRVDRKDPRYLALRNFALSISVFNVLGYTVLGFEQPWAWPFFALALGYATEISVEWLSARLSRRRAAFSGNGFWGLYTFLLPTHITALVVNMLLYANDSFGPVAFGVVVGIGAKTVLRAPIKGKMRHYMNPSNFGVTATLLAFGSWVSISPPYQFTENIPDVFRIMVPMIILTAGTVLNASLTKKIPLIAGWAGSFVIQALVRHWIWDVAIYSALAVMTGVAFVLFTNYMITDPGTSPSSGWSQFIFGSSVGVLYGVLMVFNVVYTLFFAVTLVCGARGVYWWMRWWLAKRQAVPPASEPAGQPLAQVGAVTP